MTRALISSATAQSRFFVAAAALLVSLAFAPQIATAESVAYPETRDRLRSLSDQVCDQIDGQLSRLSNLGYRGSYDENVVGSLLVPGRPLQAGSNAAGEQLDLFKTDSMGRFWGRPADASGMRLVGSVRSSTGAARSGRRYVTYTAPDYDYPGTLYAGRASGPSWMSPFEILQRRSAGHHRNLGPLDLDEVTTSYSAIRGREQLLRQRLQALGLGTKQINPVSPRNPNLRMYLRSALNVFGDL